MSFTQWKKSNANYGRKLLHSGLEGAHSGRDAFLSGRPMSPYFNETARHAAAAAAIGVGIGLLGAFSANRHRSARALAYGVLGGAIGFGAGVAWESRDFGASVLSGALRNMSRTRDEHWLEKHPIDYA